MRNDIRGHVEAKIIVAQSEIIRLQREVIDELFMLLSQHVAADEMESLPCVEKMAHAVELKTDIEGICR